MKKDSQHGNYFLITLLIVVGLLTIFIFSPFFMWLLFAMALAVIFTPLNRWISKRLFHGAKRSNFSAVITLMLIVVIVIVPIILIAIKIYSEVQNMYTFLTEEAEQTNFLMLWDSAIQYLSTFLPNQFFTTINFTNLFSEITKNVLSNLATLFSNLAVTVIGILVTFFALFYFLRDGHEILHHIIAISPLKEEESKNLIGKTQQAIYSIFRGAIAVAIIQGILSGVGLAIFGVPNPVLFGAIATITAFIPGIGTALVLIPAIIYLFFMGSTFLAIGLLIWSVLMVGLADNLLRPLLVGQYMRVHPFLVFLSVLGGLAVFGLVGLLLGPIILALFFALLDIYEQSENKRKVKQS